MLPLVVRMDAAGMVLYYQFSNGCQDLPCGVTEHVPLGLQQTINLNYLFRRDNLESTPQGGHVRVRDPCPRGTFEKKDVGQATVPAGRKLWRSIEGLALWNKVDKSFSCNTWKNRLKGNMRNWIRPYSTG
jgi:hypothetical protein